MLRRIWNYLRGLDWGIVVLGPPTKVWTDMPKPQPGTAEEVENLDNVIPLELERRWRG